jgi:hypothetical protein
MDKKLSLFAILVLAGAGGLAVVAGPILWIFPQQTAFYFAWTIKHPLTPVFMGANYFGGIGAVFAILSKRWSVARVLLPGIIVFAADAVGCDPAPYPDFQLGPPRRPGPGCLCMSAARQPPSWCTS